MIVFDFNNSDMIPFDLSSVMDKIRRRIAYTRYNQDIIISVRHSFTTSTPFLNLQISVSKFVHYEDEGIIVSCFKNAFEDWVKIYIDDAIKLWSKLALRDPFQGISELDRKDRTDFLSDCRIRFGFDKGVNNDHITWPRGI